jgi:hypothetical protein
VFGFVARGDHLGDGQFLAPQGARLLGQPVDIELLGRGVDGAVDHPHPVEELAAAFFGVPLHPSRVGDLGEVPGTVPLGNGVAVGSAGASLFLGTVGVAGPEGEDARAIAVQIAGRLLELEFVTGGEAHALQFVVLILGTLDVDAIAAEDRLELGLALGVVFDERDPAGEADLHFFTRELGAIELGFDAREEAGGLAVEFHLFLPEDVDQLRVGQFLAIDAIAHRHAQHTLPLDRGLVGPAVEADVVSLELQAAVVHVGWFSLDPQHLAFFGVVPDVQLFSLHIEGDLARAVVLGDVHVPLGADPFDLGIVGVEQHLHTDDVGRDEDGGLRLPLDGLCLWAGEGIESSGTVGGGIRGGPWLSGAGRAGRVARFGTGRDGAIVGGGLHAGRLVGVAERDAAEGGIGEWSGAGGQLGDVGLERFGAGWRRAETAGLEPDFEPFGGPHQLGTFEFDLAERQHAFGARASVVVEFTPPSAGRGGV